MVQNSYKVMSLCAGYTNSGQNHKQKDDPETEMNGCYCCGNHFEKSFPIAVMDLHGLITFHFLSSVIAFFSCFLFPS